MGTSACEKIATYDQWKEDQENMSAYEIWQQYSRTRYDQEEEEVHVHRNTFEKAVDWLVNSLIAMFF